MVYASDPPQVACNFPRRAFQAVSGGPVFFKYVVGARSFQVPCGKCNGCLIERSQLWALRCWHEAQLFEVNSFVTLTYKEPPKRGLDVEECLLFVRRVRERLNSGVRYFVGGEYGSRDGRPHYHCLLFGIDFPDRTEWKRCESGETLYRSKCLESLWSHGFSSVGSLSYASAAYVARYCMKKSGAGDRVDGRSPEFQRMSLRPGLGFQWLRRFVSDVYPSGKCVIAGKDVKVPRYYDNVFRVGSEAEYLKIAAARRVEMDKRLDELSPARLRAREEIIKARVKFLRRDL